MQKIGDKKTFLQRVFIKKHDCWLWLGSKSSYGYGIYVLNGKSIPAHRYAYERFNGPIPKGLQIDHLCRVKNCVNPTHLEVVTQLENIRRGVPYRKKIRGKYHLKSRRGGGKSK